MATQSFKVKVCPFCGRNPKVSVNRCIQSGTGTDIWEASITCWSSRCKVNPQIIGSLPIYIDNGKKVVRDDVIANWNKRTKKK